jgi:H(+)-translocating pyrophosphatase
MSGLSPTFSTPTTSCIDYSAPGFEFPYHERTNPALKTDNVTSVLIALIAGVICLIVAKIFSWQIWDLHNDKLDTMPRTKDLSGKIAAGAVAFLKSEYTGLAVFVLVLAICLLFGIDFVNDDGKFEGGVPGTSVSFVLGAILSATTGYLGMIIATRANVRTALAVFTAGEDEGLNAGLKVAFKSGSVMANCVVGCGLFGLTICFLIFFNDKDSCTVDRSWNQLAGFAFGASSIALFARVGGGIYTKAADVGADLVGKVEEGLAEDDPENPATIADNVGDNVGDVAGMGADLFESFVGSIIAAGTLGFEQYGYPGVALPFWLAGVGALLSVVGTFFVRAKSKAAMDAVIEAHFVPPKGTPEPDLNKKKAKIRAIKLEDLLWVIRKAIYGTSFVVLIASILVIELTFGLTERGWKLFVVILLGSLTGNLIGFFTEYSTSYTEWPTQSIAQKSETGPATVIIQGLGIGMLSTIPPVMFLVVCILSSYYLAGIYGISISAVSMLSTLGITLATDAYGPVADNAGGIAEMAGDEIEDWVRDETDSLDALGNTTAATGKGFAIGSAVLTALALMNAFSKATGVVTVDLLDAVVLPGILIGALLPFVFAALTMLSVGKAAEAIMYECRDQLNKKASENTPLDPARCVAISTHASLIEMVPPGTVAVFSPMVVGGLLGVNGLMGLLAGSISSGFLLAVTMSNAGGAWDNSKKYIESQGKKGTVAHVAVVVGDTVGDPFKDTSGPALNILIKLMSVVSLVMAPAFKRSAWKTGPTIFAVVVLILVSIFLIIFKCRYSEGTFTKEQMKAINEASDLRKGLPVADDAKGSDAVEIEMSPSNRFSKSADTSVDVN